MIVGVLILLGGSAFAQTKKWSLQDCINYAIENNVSIKKSELDRNTAGVNLKQQINNRLPNLSGSATGNFSNGAAIDPITSSFVNQQVFSNNFGVSGSVTLYQGGKLNLQIEQNKILLQQSELYLQESQNNITLNVLEAYLQALYYNEGIVITENTLKSSQEELAQTQVKFKNGAVSQLDLSSIETQNSTNEYNVVTAKNQYSMQVLALKQLLEIDPEEEFEIENLKLDDLTFSIPDKQVAYANAVANLPDIRIYDLIGENLEREIQITKAEYMPSISLSYGLNSGYTNTMDYGFGYQLRSNFKQSVGLSLSVPIFAKYQKSTSMQLTTIQLRQNELDRVSASKTLYSKIETAYQNAIVNMAQSVSAKSNRDNAQLSYELASKKFAFGGLTATELAVSRNTYLNAEQTLLQNKYLAVLYQSLLKFYQGESVINHK